MGLYPAKHLGKEIAVLDSYLHKLKELYGINVCGEGGEYETLTLDCPLFVNARIMLDEYQVVMHSSNSIAPVGVLHPLGFHLENKVDSSALTFQEKTQEISMEKAGFVFEVQGDSAERCETTCKSIADVSDVVDDAECKLRISRTKNKSTFSICCWLQDSCSGLQEDLKAVLLKIESQLVGFGFGWEDVLYIHLYIDDMNEFSVANETYVQFITQEKCPFGVPSRSTIELPLLQVGLGSAYIEVLVANDHSKRVLHVQSISCWAPSCIGPYSQATLHKNILHMAGQLGLDPATMILCNGEPSDELEQALKNSDARREIQEKLDSYLKHMRLFDLKGGRMSETLDPIFLYVLVPDLPKRASLEVKPILFVAEDTEATTKTAEEVSCIKAPRSCGFEHAGWHDLCIQKCVVCGKICSIILSITSEQAAKICSDSLSADQNNDDKKFIKAHVGRISKFCIYLLDKVLVENAFSWEDTMNLRLYIPTSLQVPMETLLLMFSNPFSELAEMRPGVPIGKEPIFNIVPVLGAGTSASSLDDILTFELLAQKS
ncbi:diphthine--ammonia ligase [Quillaja saponaria]|nr:diphthine--ammonia ligase [Quillaja saponaria]